MTTQRSLLFFLPSRLSPLQAEVHVQLPGGRARQAETHHGPAGPPAGPGPGPEERLRLSE